MPLYTIVYNIFQTKQKQKTKPKKELEQDFYACKNKLQIYRQKTNVFDCDILHKMSSNAYAQKEYK